MPLLLLPVSFDSLSTRNGRRRKLTPSLPLIFIQPGPFAKSNLAKSLSVAKSNSFFDRVDESSTSSKSLYPLLSLLLFHRLPSFSNLGSS